MLLLDIIVNVSKSGTTSSPGLLIEPIAIPELDHTGINIDGDRAQCVGQEGAGSLMNSVCFYSNGKKSKMMKERIRKILQSIDEREATAVHAVHTRQAKAIVKRKPIAKPVAATSEKQNMVLFSRHRSRPAEKPAESLIRKLRSEATTKQHIFKYL